METSEPRVEVVVDMQLSDLVRANLWFTYSRRAMQFSLLVSCLLFLAFGVLLVLADVPNGFAFIPLGILLLIGITPLTIILNSRRNLGAVKEFQKHVRYIFDADGYEAKDGKSSANVSWESIQKAVESKRSFNLFITRQLFVVIPKRCIKSNSDFLNLRSILQQALREKAKVRSSTQ
jgi:hypothetical protein